MVWNGKAHSHRLPLSLATPTSLTSLTTLASLSSLNSLPYSSITSLCPSIVSLMSLIILISFLRFSYENISLKSVVSYSSTNESLFSKTDSLFQESKGLVVNDVFLFICLTKSEWCQSCRSTENLRRAKRPPILAIAVSIEVEGCLLISWICGENRT